MRRTCNAARHNTCPKICTFMQRLSPWRHECAQAVSVSPAPPTRAEERQARRLREQLTYRAAAIAASSSVVLGGVMATYWRFCLHADTDGGVPVGEYFATLALVFGGMVRPGRLTAAL